MRSKFLDTRTNILNNIGDFNRNVSKAKELFSVNELVGLFRMLKNNSKYKEYLYNIQPPKNYDGLIVKHSFPVVYFSSKNYEENIENYNMQEMKFLTAIICFYNDTIQKFLKARKAFEHYFMLSEYANAELILDDFEKTVGYSFWGIEARLAIYFLKNAEQTAFDYCYNISQLCNNKAIGFYIEILRDKMSLDINQRLFKERFDRNIKLINQSNTGDKYNTLEMYANFSCFVQEKLTPTYFRNIIISSSSLSVIDKYILLEKLVLNIATEPLEQYNHKFLKCFSDCLENLSNYSGNVLWDNIKLLLGHEVKFDINAEKQIVHKALSYFCCQKYDKCWRFCRDKLQEYGNNFSLINLMAKIKTIDEPKSQYENLIQFINALYQKKSNESYFELANKCDIYERFYANFTFGNELISIIENETSNNKVICKKQYLASLLTYNFVPSKLVFFLPNKNQTWFLDEYKKFFQELYMCDWQLISHYELLNPILVEHFTYDEISKKIIILSNANIDTVIDLKGCEKYLNYMSTVQTVREFDYYSNNNLYQEAINTYIQAYLSNFWLVIKIDYLKLNRKINRRFEQTYGNTIEYCVYSAITKYNWQETEKVSESVVSSYKRTMRRNDQEYPSKLSWPISAIDKKCHAYFLRFICVNEVLHRCDPPFKYQQNINEERINIVRSLIQYYKDIDDSESLNVLNEELDDLLKYMEIEDITNLIDNAKIDTSLIHISNNTDDAIVLTNSRCFVNSKNNNFNSEKEKYFEYLTGLSIFKKNYVNEVNRILSSSIRHGVLEDKIIQYFNSFGIDKDASDNENINIFLCNVYDLINYVIDKYIWATSEKDSNGEITLYIPEDIAQKYYSEMANSITTPESLRKYYMKIFETQLSQELNRIGGLVFDKLYSSLYEHLNELIDKTTGREKNEFNKCKDTLESELLKIKQWFGIIEYKTVKYNLTTFLDLFKENHHKILLKKNIAKDYKISGSTMNYLNNILFNFVSNAIKHSGFNESSKELKLILSVNQFNDTNLFTFDLSNNVSNLIESKNIFENIKNIDGLILNKNNIESYQSTEGKSGYQKIIYLLEQIFIDSWCLNVTFNETERIFNVKLNIELE